MARILSLFSSGPRVLVIGVAVSMLMFIACGPEDLGNVAQPGKTVEPSIETGKPLDFWGGKNHVGVPGAKPPAGTHLSSCENTSDCSTGKSCINLFGGPLCFYKCEPDKGTGNTQNPNCIEPENCVRLNDGSGICVAIPGQLYGIGSYQAVVNHKQGERCLLRFGGCEAGLICVDLKQEGSIGTCEEVCTPAIKGSKNQPNCQTAGTTCKTLSSGLGACLK